MVGATGHANNMARAAAATAALSLASSEALGASTSSSSAAAALSYLSFSLRDPTLLPTVSSDDVGAETGRGGGVGVGVAGQGKERKKAFFPVFDPAATSDEVSDGRAVIAKVVAMDREDARKAIERSFSALPSWRDGTTGSRRSSVLSRWSSLIKDHADDLATIMTRESGKPLKESRGEVSYGASFLDYYAAEAIRPSSAGGGFLVPTPFAGGTGPGESPPRGKVMAIHEAVGVTAMITPWNFPIAMITRKVGPALAAGCTAVVKPSDLTPLTALAIKELADRAGLPDGVLEIVTADRDTATAVGEEFCSNPIVKKLSFTGSTAVGKLLMKLGSDTVKRMSLELGGNAAFIVFDDADIDVAVDAAIASKYRNAGQTCVCSDRFLVHRSVHDEFVTKFAGKVRSFIVGRGMDDGTNVGPLVTDLAVLKVKEKVDDAIKGGADCIVGGNLMPDLGPNFYQPSILCNVDPMSALWSTETFGPVAAIRAFDEEDEAVELANDTTTGLASYFCSRDLSRVLRVAGRLENGIVGVNDGIISTATAPFGGVKESGLGREGSSLGIAEYLETKYIFINA